MPTPIHPEETVCIFVFPPSLTFYADDPSTHKQILTIHNPYGCHLKFRILCTDTNKYTVSESQGYIKPMNAQDLVVRHKAVSPNNIGVADTIRVQVFASGQSRPLGMKEISVSLQATKPEPSPPPPYSAAALDAERFQQLNAEAALSGFARQRRGGRDEERSQPTLAHTVVCVIISVACVTVLNLPREDEASDFWPSYLLFSHHVRLIAAFVLGCMTTLFIRS